MTIETHITTFTSPEQVTDYAEDGTYIHGLFVEGAKFDEDGSLVESRLKELMPSAPVKSVPIKPDWEASPVGYLRHDLEFINVLLF